MKKFFIILIILFMTGCSVNYDLTVTDKGKVKEKFYISNSNEKILQENSSIKEYLNYYSSLYKQNNFYKNYKITTKKSNPDSYFIVTNEYKSLNDYINSLSYLSMFDSANIDKIGDYTTFVSSKNAYLDKIKNGGLISEENKYENFKINIKFYNEVVESNADEVDEKNNIYTWIVSESNSNDYVYFKIGPKKNYLVIIKDYIQTNFISICLVGGAFLAIIIAVMLIFVKSKKNNEV